ncbi:U1 putative protein [Bimbo virus]|uniref:Uncharacterized protein n=1 Tax=Bimbo virus TaxID=864694 RepID=A0AAE8XBL6_9RHAB|nr:U1 putative protein [Bimbo virus]UAU42867.1 U1 putative protein [Bimbo virus]
MNLFIRFHVLKLDERASIPLPLHKMPILMKGYGSPLFAFHFTELGKSLMKITGKSCQSTLTRL